MNFERVFVLYILYLLRNYATKNNYTTMHFEFLVCSNLTYMSMSSTVHNVEVVRTYTSEIVYVQFQ